MCVYVCGLDETGIFFIWIRQRLGQGVFFQVFVYHSIQFALLFKQYVTPPILIITKQGYKAALDSFYVNTNEVWYHIAFSYFQEQDFAGKVVSIVSWLQKSVSLDGNTMLKIFTLLCSLIGNKSVVPFHSVPDFLCS